MNKGRCRFHQQSKGAGDGEDRVEQDTRKDSLWKRGVDEVELVEGKEGSWIDPGGREWTSQCEGGWSQAGTEQGPKMWEARRGRLWENGCGQPGWRTAGSTHGLLIYLS